LAAAAAGAQEEKQCWPVRGEVVDARERKGGSNVILDAAFKARVIQFQFLLLSSMILWELERAAQAQQKQQHSGGSPLLT
jgi:hypothetical protein